MTTDIDLAIEQTFKAASVNSASGPVSTAEFIAETTSFLTTIGSNPDGSGSFQAFIEDALASTSSEARLPSGWRYGFYSNENLAEIPQEYVTSFTEATGEGAGYLESTPFATNFMDDTNRALSFSDAAVRLQSFYASKGWTVTDFRGSSDLSASLANVAWNRASIDYARNAAASGKDIFGFIDNGVADRTFGSLELPILRQSGAIFDGLKLTSDMSFEELATKTASARRLARALGGAWGLTEAEVLGKTDFFSGYDYVNDSLVGQPESFWKTLKGDEAGLLSLDILDRAALIKLPSETLAEAGARVLKEKLASFDDYFRSATERFSNMVRDPIGGGTSLLLGAGFGGTLIAANAYVTAEQEGAWAGALEAALGGTALVVGGLAFAGVTAMLVEASMPVAAIGVTTLGIGAGLFGLVDQVDRLVGRLSTDDQQPPGSNLAIVSLFSPSNGRSEPNPPSSTPGNQVFAIGEQSIVVGGYNPFSDGNDIVQAVLVREIDTGAGDDLITAANVLTPSDI